MDALAPPKPEALPPPNALLSLKDDEEAVAGAPARSEEVETEEMRAPCPPAPPQMLRERYWGAERVMVIWAEGV